MPLVSSRARLTAAAVWALSKANTGANATEHKGDPSFSLVIDASTYDQVFFAQYTIAASGTQLVDFYGPWTNLVGESVTGASIIGVLVKVTGDTGILLIEPDGSNGLAWPFTDADPDYILTPDESGACWLHADGVGATVDATHKEWLLTNSGAAEITVTLVAFIGT